MRWERLRRSSNVVDRRGQGARRGLGLPLGRRGGGLGFVVILILAAVFGGPEVLNLLIGEGLGPLEPASPPGAPRNDQDLAFVSAILGSTEDVWGAVFAAAGQRYDPPSLTLFDGSVDSACGFATSAAGPFYCPADRRVYLDTAFFAELARMGGPGDFAQAYVIGHEIGHHVQTLEGTAASVRSQQRGASESQSNALQVSIELQADCFAGIWAYHANQRDRVLESGDVEEGVAAAAAIGDDTLQRNAGRRVTPDSFTHGTSAQRQRALTIGLQSGDLAACRIG